MAAGGVVSAVSWPLVTAHLPGAHMHELVRVGHQLALGDVVRLDARGVTILMYETATLAVGDPIVRTGQALSAMLAPGIIGRVFDGVQRPVDTIADVTQSLFIPPRGTLDQDALDREIMWDFNPRSDIQLGDFIGEGDIFGEVRENSVFNHRLLVQPGVTGGTVVSIAPAGQYALDHCLLRTASSAGTEVAHTMQQRWPVRTPRPTSERLEVNEPLNFGQRVHDALFPAALGSVISMPGASGCGCEVTKQQIVGSDSFDCFVRVGKGGRGNEDVELLKDFTQATFETADGRQEPVMKRGVLVVASSSAPALAREAALYTATTIAEYLRDMGLHVALIIDSLPRWAESLNESAQRLGEQLPGERCWAPDLRSRLSALCGRAGRHELLGQPARTGSVTLLAGLDPAGGDFSDPVVSATLDSSAVFWAIDRKLAGRKHFPSINWLSSYSHELRVLEPWHAARFPQFSDYRSTMAQILKQEENIEEVQTLASFAVSDRLLLSVAKLIREDFLAQNCFSLCDRRCPLYKTYWMMKNICELHNCAEQAIRTIEERCSGARDAPPTWDALRAVLEGSDDSRLMYKLATMKFQDPADGEQAVTAYYASLNAEIRDAFALLV